MANQKSEVELVEEVLWNNGRISRLGFSSVGVWWATFQGSGTVDRGREIGKVGANATPVGRKTRSDEGRFAVGWDEVVGDIFDEEALTLWGW